MQTLDIEKLSKRGDGQSNNIQIPGAIPGDQILATVRRKKGVIEEVVRASPDRVAPRCAHFGDCGGCRLQAMDYEAQLRYKERWVAELFEVEPLPIIGCEEPWHYRNKMEYSFSQDRSGNRFLGLMRLNGRGRVVDLESCHIAPPWFSEALALVRGAWGNDRAAFHPPTGSGLLRTLTLREGRRTGERLAMLTVAEKEGAELLEPLREMVDTAVLQVQVAVKGQPTRFEQHLLWGSGLFHEELHLPGREPMRFRVSPTAFLQPNTLQAERLYGAALELAGSAERVCDLFCGTGTIGILAAAQSGQVHGVEIVPEAIEDARHNARLNRVENVEFTCGDAAQVELGEMDLVIVDPPRAGLGGFEINAKKILYISCNPVSQAEDVKLLMERGFRLEALQPVDQFPHTAHLENIALLTRSSI
jgi:23S rRNA (uracil1939-C5)-methyltransferase